MKCNEPMPNGSYRECDRELLHEGAHSYLGQTWPRLEPEVNEEIADLIAKAAGPMVAPWELNERRFPVIVERTTTYLMWQEAESEDEALAALEDDYEIDLTHGMVITGDQEVRRPNQWERREATVAAGGRLGPQLQCPDCGDLSFTRAWYHDPLRWCHGPIEWVQHSRTSRTYRQPRRAPVYVDAEQGGAA
ncbi:hypothetical protein ACFWDF_34545 [Streptomyces diastaticus]|uniref:hypothetical protein n=1 Tax=Streptomyces diastaticus TaxID=1956 RepID=UPI0036B9D416